MSADAAAAPDPRELEALATRIARSAGDAALAGRRRGLGEVETKTSPTDLVTEHDKASEALIVAALRAERPSDRIVAEEGTELPGRSGITWHIDPIDGTANFFFDLPTWAVSIGAVDENGPLAGAVYSPPLGEMFSAARGAGARLDGRPIAPRPNDDLSDALVATGFSYSAADRLRQSRRIPEMIDRIRDLRRFGAAALDICFVACGRLDAYFEENLHSWDVLAAELIAREAGARSGDFSGGPLRPAEVLVSGPGVFDALSNVLVAASRKHPHA